MPPQLNKDLNETLQSILDKLANLQIQLNTTLENHDGGYIAFNQALESRQTALETMQNTLNHALTTLLSTLSSHSTTIPPPHDMAFDALHISSKHHVFHSTPTFHPFQAVFTTTTTPTFYPCIN
ncbi:hypothetical protein V8G54_037699 [Vigna mungo]|uniref:Uncharacterized protein n=1 Tax=Vigna mungo TaxID=3915 RepID=A0AAQ3RHS2_VIGMU